MRQFSPSDAARLHALVDDKQVAASTQYIPYPFPAGAAEEWLREHDELVKTGQAVVFAICLKRDSSESQSSESESDDAPILIGTVGLALANVDHQGELGYWLGRDYWSQGFCSEAVQRLVDFGFDDLGLNRIFAQHIAWNAASSRVLVKAGFQKEGVLRQHARKWGVFEDVACYGMLHNDPRPQGGKSTE